MTVMAKNAADAGAINWTFYDASRSGGYFQSAGQTASYQYNSPGSYSVRLIVQNIAGCSDTSIHSFTVSATPQLLKDPFGPIYTCNTDTTLTLAGAASYTGTGSLTWRLGEVAMDARAIVIGIDQYAGNSLTSAVHDAEAFRDSLIKLGLVQPEHIAFLRNTEADRDHIGAALKNIYDNGAGLDRLFFYFSGHGMMAPVDAAGAVWCTALIPSDVTDLAADSYRLINFDDLCSRLRFAGPKEQFFFIDACRDLALAPAPILQRSRRPCKTIRSPDCPSRQPPRPGPSKGYVASVRAPPLEILRCGKSRQTGHLRPQALERALESFWHRQVKPATPLCLTGL